MKATVSILITCEKDYDKRNEDEEYPTLKEAVLRARELNKNGYMRDDGKLWHVAASITSREHRFLLEPSLCTQEQWDALEGWKPEERSPENQEKLIAKWLEAEENGEI